MPRLRDLTGQTFHRVKILRRGPNHPKSGRVQWFGRCACGTERLFVGDYLFTGRTKSCGCLHVEMAIEKNRLHCTTHGMKGTPTYSTWRSMMTRCYVPANISYHRYGGLGIEVCKRWHTFENFFEDMGVRPAGMTIDRLDNTLGYFKNNCRWATAKQQANHRASSLYLTFRGETKTASQWAEITGLGRSTIENRLHMGWPHEFILTTRPLTQSEATLSRYGKIDIRKKEFRYSWPK